MSPGTFPNDCTPTAFHYVSGISYPKVLEICIRVGGWDSAYGVGGNRFKDIAEELGLTLGKVDEAWHRHEDGSFKETSLGRIRKQTVGQFIRSHPNGTYFVHTADHVFAVINGKNMDRARTGLKTRILYFQEVKPDLRS